jgi:hypothetical protein
MPLTIFNFKKLRSSLPQAVQAQPEVPPLDVQQRARTMVNSLLASRGLDPATCCNSDGTFWVIPLRPVPVVIRLIRVEPEREETPATESAGGTAHKSEPDDFIEVSTHLMRLPAYPLLAVYRFLLEMNMRLIGTAFAIDEGSIYLRSQRRINDLDESEIDEMISATVVVANGTLPIMLEQFSVGVVPN